MQLSLPAGIVSWDHNLTRAETAPGPTGRLLWKVVTFGGYAELWGVVYLTLLLWPGGITRPLGARLLAAEILCLAILIPLRYMFRRERPTPKKPGPVPIPWERYSFPSSHALRSQSAAVVLAVSFPMLWFVSVPLALLVGWSRVPLRRHFPSDVLVGTIVGFACGLLATWLVGRLS